MNNEYVKEITLEKLEEFKQDHALRRETEIGFILQMEVAAYQSRLEVTIATSKGHTLNFIVYDPPAKKNTPRTPCDEYTDPLTPAMDNVLASRLGIIARESGEPDRIDVGDSIDRGLILRRLLEEKGFYLVMKK